MGSTFSTLDEFVNNYHLLDERNKREIGTHLCNAENFMSTAMDIFETGDGQGFERGTDPSDNSLCGKRKVNYTDSNPCKEGYTLAGPKHLNPQSKYDKDPCIYFNKDECLSNK